MSDIGVIGTTGHKSPRRLPFQIPFSKTPYQMIQQDQYKLATHFRSTGPTYLHPLPQPVYATQAPQRPHVLYHQQHRAPSPPRPIRQFTQLGIPLSRAFQRLVEGGLIACYHLDHHYSLPHSDSGQIFIVPTIRERVMIQTVVQH